MKYRFFFLLILITGCSLISGCSLLKNSKTTTGNDRALIKRQSDLRLNLQKDWLKDSGSFTSYKDSNKQDYSVQLWPKGVFTYSAEKGFSGMADSILIRGKSAGILTGSQLTTVLEVDKGNVSIKLSQNKKLNTKQNKKVIESSVSWKWVLAGSILILIAGIACIKIFKNSR